MKLKGYVCRILEDGVILAVKDNYIPCVVQGIFYIGDLVEFFGDYEERHCSKGIFYLFNVK